MRHATCCLLAIIVGIGTTGTVHARQSSNELTPALAPHGLPAFVGDLASVRALIDSGVAQRDPQLLNKALDLLVPTLLKRDAPPEAWYLAGRARYQLAILGVVAHTRDRGLIGMSYAQRAAVALREALKRDPNYALAATLLADSRLRTLAHIGSHDDAAAIRSAAPLTSTNAQTLLARAQIELDWGNPDSAIAAAGRVLELGGDSALALLSFARGQLMAGQLDTGKATWFRALGEVRSEAARSVFRQDFAWVATDAEMEAFDSLSRAEWATWAHAFWERRAAAAFRSVGERIAEHERRIRLARVEFALRVHDRDFNKAMPYRSDQRLVDDRGVIFIRHGPPTRVLRSGTEAVQGCPVFSWLYEDGPDRGMIVSFRPYFTLMHSPIAFCAYADFKLVPGVWAGDNLAMLADYDSTYARWLEEHRPLRRAALRRQVASASMDNITLAVTTDAYPLHFDHSLNAVLRAYGLARPGRLLVAFGIPPQSLEQISLGGRPALPLRLRVTALSKGGASPVTFDTTLIYDARRPVRPNQWVAGAVDFPVATGEYEIRWLLTGADPTAGSSGLQLGVDVPAPVAGRPTVSALLLGTPNTELRWPTPAGVFPLSASNAYRVGDDMEVFLEAQDLPNCAPVTVRTRIEPADGAKGRSVATQVTEHAIGTRLAVRLSLHLSELKPGYYRLTVELEGDSIRSVSRSQPFWIVE